MKGSQRLFDIPHPAPLNRTNHSLKAVNFPFHLLQPILNPTFQHQANNNNNPTPKQNTNQNPHPPPTNPPQNPKPLRPKPSPNSPPKVPLAPRTIFPDTQRSHSPVSTEGTPPKSAAGRNLLSPKASHSTPSQDVTAKRKGVKVYPRRRARLFVLSPGPRQHHISKATGNASAGQNKVTYWGIVLSRKKQIKFHLSVQSSQQCTVKGNKLKNDIQGAALPIPFLRQLLLRLLLLKRYLSLHAMQNFPHYTRTLYLA
jgi:hypothetical protein